MKKKEGKRIVILIEGVHGVGKTAVLEEIKKEEEKKDKVDYLILKENFIDKKNEKELFNPQSFYKEVTWAMEMFNRIERACTRTCVCNNKKEVLFVDRSPYTAIFYNRDSIAKENSSIKNIIDKIFRDFKEKGIHLYTICLVGKPEKIWNRVNERLKKEPERLKYTEDDRKWFNKQVGSYSNFKWDYIVENNGTIEECTKNIKKIVDNILK
jgi:thymidylate kinase